MCGRFTQHYTWAEVHDILDLFGPQRNLRARYNIAPTTDVDVLRLGEAGRELVTMRWGLVPFFWKKTLKQLPASRASCAGNSASSWSAWSTSCAGRPASTSRR